MTRLQEMLKRLQRKHGEWRLDGQKVIVDLSGRQQAIELDRKGSDYIFRSVVLSGTEVTQNNKRWRELARLAWHRNSQQEVVAFGFDDSDRMIGQIRHPADYLDDEELEFYVSELAWECDRFEYLLTGEDRY